VAGQGPLSAGLRLLPWGIAPFLIAPRAGALADKIGERALVVTGAALEAGGMAWIAAAVSPTSGYPALIAPMTLVGVGFALAIPAVTRAVTSAAPLSDIGKASGAFSTMRQLGGAFGVAIIGATFAAAGNYATPAAFSDGATAAFAAAAGIALAGVLAAVVLPRRAHRAPSAPAEPRLTSGTAQAPAESTQ
jgi:MFS family permease